MAHLPTRAGERWVVSESALVSWCAGRIEIASAVSGTTFQTDDPDVVRVIHAFARARPVEEVVRELGAYPQEDVVACVEELVEAGILVASSAEDPAAAHGWDPSALAFHRRSRAPRLRTRPGKPAAAAVRRPARTVPLDRLSLEPGRDLAGLLEDRRSWRAWPSRAIAREAFSALLWLSARDREGLGEGEVDRPYPSGGAVYSLELYPVLAPEAVDAIPAGVYRYLPGPHGLEPLSAEAADYRPFLEAAAVSAGCDPPPVVLVVTSRFAGQAEAYGDLAYSLVLKEVGALYQTLYLVAGYLDLAPCALGGGSPDELMARLCGRDELEEPVVGEFMLGPHFTA